MGFAERAMNGEEKSVEDRPRRLLEAHVTSMARVAMALVGDAASVERVLEIVAREANAAPERHEKAWLLGRVRAACANVATGTPAHEVGPVRTARLGASEAIAARGVLQGLRPTEREAVVLRLVGGLDVAEIALACNVDAKTAHERLAAGLGKVLRAEGE